MSGILVSLRVGASPERAFEAFTREIGLWWRPNTRFRFTSRLGGVLSFEPGVGGRLVETFANGEIFEIGRITHWEPSVRLEFNWRQDGFGREEITHVIVRFERTGDETRVTVEHIGWDSVSGAHVARHGFPDDVFMRRHGEWWQGLLASFVRRVAE
jgi:uncharacterized protein YndB with AHSA1/START domain